MRPSGCDKCRRAAANAAAITARVRVEAGSLPPMWCRTCQQYTALLTHCMASSWRLHRCRVAGGARSVAGADMSPVGRRAGRAAEWQQVGNKVARSNWTHAKSCCCC